MFTSYKDIYDSIDDPKKIINKRGSIKSGVE